MGLRKEGEIFLTDKIKYYLLVGAFIYSTGMIAQAVSSKSSYYELSGLKCNKKELASKIKGWEKQIPLMTESDASKYRDSLINAAEDTSRMNHRLSELEKEMSKCSARLCYSWAGFFIKND